MLSKNKNHYHNRNHHHNDKINHNGTTSNNNQNKCYYYYRHRIHTNVILLFCRKRFLLMMLALFLGCSKTNGSNILDQNRNEILYSDYSSVSNSSNNNRNSNTSSSSSNSNSNSDSSSNSSSSTNGNGQYSDSSNNNEFKQLNNQINSIFTKPNQIRSFTNDDNSIDTDNPTVQSFQMVWQKSKWKSSILSKSSNSTKFESIQSNSMNNSISIKKINDKNNQPNTYTILKTNLKSYPIRQFDKINRNEMNSMENDRGITRLEKILLRYFENMLASQTYELFTGLQFDSNNHSIIDDVDSKDITTRNIDSRSLDDTLLREVQNNKNLNINLPRAVETGRLFFFKGLKKILWPLFIGVQIAKTILLALFLPSILGSLGKMVGKGITSVSGFHHPSETVSDLDFKDNGYEFDQGTKYNEYMYPQPQSEASTNHFTQIYDAAAINNNALSRFGFGDQKLMYINTPATDIYMKNSRPNTNLMTTNKNNFKIFHDIPASSLLLTNYDPFYSPLLSRLDAVFQQLGLGSGNEICREKLVCLMYSNPAKYAPYSNLVSAQLSRELNELRKPTSDNPDILRFFKYMKSAKNGQDGTNCEQAYNGCTNFKDSENPAMLTTYHEINKLVQARKFK